MLFDFQGYSFSQQMPSQVLGLEQSTGQTRDWWGKVSKEELPQCNTLLGHQKRGRRAQGVCNVRAGAVAAGLSAGAGDGCGVLTEGCMVLQKERRRGHGGQGRAAAETSGGSWRVLLG